MPSWLYRYGGFLERSVADRGVVGLRAIVGEVPDQRLAARGLAHLEAQIKMGFKEGYSVCLDQLEEVVARLAKKGK